MKVAVLGEEGITGKAVISRLNAEPGYEIVPLKEAELIVTSPGIPPAQYPHVKVPIISEIELAYRLLKDTKIIAVTGTNGKTTTTTLISKILNCPAAGNIGLPLISIKEPKSEYIVVEVSSYQLETIVDFKPFISIILNITPDHLEWHGSMNAYAQAKAKIFKNQTSQEYLIYNEKDILVKELVQNVSAQKVSLRPHKALEQNILAARAVAKICGIKDEVVDAVINNFKGVEHRIEEVATINGVKIINDSKATNPEATVVALESFEVPVVLIAGGKDKHTSLEQLGKIAKEKVKHMVLLGEAAGRFAKELASIPFTIVQTLEAAVTESLIHAQKGEVVLLSPACASFDMFKNYEDRGAQFKKIVLHLK